MVPVQVGEEGAKPGGQAEDQDDFFLAPAVFERVVIVDRRHPEQASAGGFEIVDLDDHGELLGQVDDEEQRNEDLHLFDHGEKAERTADRERAGVAHEGAGRVFVVKQESEEAADHREGKDLHFAGVSDQEEEQIGRDGDVDQQAVKAIGEVDRVGRPDDEEQGQDDEGADVQVERDRAGDRDFGGQAELREQEVEQAAGEEELQHELEPAGDAARVLEGCFFKIIEKADECEQQEGRAEKIGKHRALVGQRDRQAEQQDQARHQRRAFFRLMIGGQFLADRLGEAEAMQEFDQQGHQERGDEKGDPC